MAKKEQLYNKKGEKVYPITSTECVVDGDKKLSEILHNAQYKGAYYYFKNGFLVEVPNGASYLHVKGYHYISSTTTDIDKPIDSLIQWNSWCNTGSQNPSHSGQRIVNNGAPLKDVKLIYTNPDAENKFKTYIWFTLQDLYWSSIYLFAGGGYSFEDIPTNHIIKITDATAESVENINSIVNFKVFNNVTTGSGQCLGVVDLPATTSTLDIATLPPIADVGTLILRYNGVVQDLDTYIAPKQEGGIPIPQSNEINTLDLVNNAVPLANLNEYVGVPNNWLKIYVPINYFFEYIEKYPKLTNYFHPINGDDGKYKYWYYTGSNGLLIKTNIKDNDDTSVIRINIQGVGGAGDDPQYDSSITFRCNLGNAGLYGYPTVINRGSKKIKVVKAFVYNGYVYVHIEKYGNFVLTRVDAIQWKTQQAEYKSIDRNIINSLNSAVIPSDATKMKGFDVINTALESDLNTLHAMFEREVSLFNNVSASPGRFNKETGYGELNGLTDLTDADMMEILLAGRIIPAYANEHFAYRSKLRTNICTLGGYNASTEHKATFYACYNLEIAHVGTRWCGYGYAMFAMCHKLHTILGELTPASNGTFNEAFNGCEALQNVTFNLSNLKTNMNVSFKDSPLITLDSLKSFYNSKTDNTYAVTVTVHPDTYAKLTDSENTEWYQLNQDAITKNITFATI